MLTDTMGRWMNAYPGLTVECRAVPGEDTAQVLMDAGTEAALLVVGSRGRGGFAGLLLGSVGATLLRRSHRPVAIVHGRTTSAA